jgi:coproporphyrinogen III oxidase
MMRVPFERLCTTVEDDIEKKRHLKDPFQQHYISLLASPFQNDYIKEERNVSEICSIRQGQYNFNMFYKAYG